MSLPTSKSELLDRLRNERAQWQTLLNGIDDSQIDVPGVVGIWSVRDTLAHVLAYEQFLADRLREILMRATYRSSETVDALHAFQEKFGYPDFGSALLDDDGPNAWIVQKYRAVTFPSLTDLEEQVFKDIQDLLAELPAWPVIRSSTIRSTVRIFASGWQRCLTEQSVDQPPRRIQQMEIILCPNL